MPQIIKLRGAGMLKVVSIIMIILGAISLASGVFTPNSGNTLVNVLGVDPIAIQYFQILGAIAIISGAVTLVCGIFGVKLCNNAEKIHTLLIVGIVNAIVTVFTSVYNFITLPMGVLVMDQVAEAMREMGSPIAGNMNMSGVMQNGPMMIIGYVLPALFIVGVLLNKLPPKVPNAPVTPPWEGGADQ